MTTTTLGDGVLKTDRLGRVKTPVERREALVDEYERSGMSGQAFAGHYGIKYQTFATWVQKRGKERAARGPGKDPMGQMQLVEAVVEGGRAGLEHGKAAVRVELPGGASVEVGDAGQAMLVGQLLRAYSEPEKPC
jgi:transposase-like protein